MAALSAPTLKQLLVNVRTLLKQRDPNNSNWTDQELTTYLNDGVALYFLECAQADEGYFTTTTNLNIVANTETIALPTDFFQVKNLWKAVNGGYVCLSYVNALTEGYSTQGGTGSATYLPQYKFQGNNLVLSPTPNFSETSGIKLEYIQFPDTMVWGGDSISNQVSPIFKQLIEMFAVYKAKLSESLVNGSNLHAHAEANLAALYKAFKDAITKRSKNPTFISPFNPEM